MADRRFFRALAATLANNKWGMLECKIRSHFNLEELKELC